MCAERIHRIMVAVILTGALIAFSLGMLRTGVVFQAVVILMFVVWAWSGACFSLWILRKIFGPCDPIIPR